MASSLPNYSVQSLLSNVASLTVEDVNRMRAFHAQRMQQARRMKSRCSPADPKPYMRPASKTIAAPTTPRCIAPSPPAHCAAKAVAVASPYNPPYGMGPSRSASPYYNQMLHQTLAQNSATAADASSSMSQNDNIVGPCSPAAHYAGNVNLPLQLHFYNNRVPSDPVPQYNCNVPSSALVQYNNHSNINLMQQTHDQQVNIATSTPQHEHTQAMPSTHHDYFPASSYYCASKQSSTSPASVLPAAVEAGNQTPIFSTAETSSVLDVDLTNGQNPSATTHDQEPAPQVFTLDMLNDFLFSDDIAELKHFTGDMTNMICATSIDTEAQDHAHAPIPSDVQAYPSTQAAECMQAISCTSILEEDPNSSTLPEPKIQNVVCTVNLECEIDLKQVAYQALNADYNPHRFPGVIMRLRQPKTTSLIFKTGKMVCTGAKNEDDAELAARRHARILQKLGYKLATYKADGAFPGLVYKMKKPHVNLLMFTTGKVVLIGDKKKEEVKKALKNIYPVLLQHKKMK
ncbi:hypothetical protein GOP47_0000741 [Adiantum capillus-veneris]|uniref:TATA-box-binding protein n=1 Tax=Adiantum capillus-veneris TaxID=13818 RepID=A0A9D4VDV6_ADICA|nr:hypothetical protein GOP47_0000738 [Adiantum capillus-veneris]KAI5084572.1 hypothetical protein GOP47_0000741 [Adiantum capillus-veneris]